MAQDKVELSNINVTPHDEARKSKTARDDASLIEKQTRTRRLFTLPQIFCFALMYFGTWPGMGSGMYFALANGGPAAYFFNSIIAGIGAMSQAAALGELASLMPIAGAQYYWTFRFAPPKYRMFLTWLAGWTTWLGYVCGLAGVINGSALYILSGAQLNFPEVEITGWQVCLVMLADLSYLVIANVWLFRLVPWFELFSGILNIIFFFITVVSLWVMSPRNSPEFLLTVTSSSGWDNQFISWNVGMLTQIFMFIGFEGVIHLGEETKNPGRAAPVAMIWALVANVIMGLIIVITYIFCMPGYEDTINSSYPMFYIFENSTGSKTWTTVLVIGIGFAGLACDMSFFSSVSRMTWAWARDGGLPAYFGHVSGSRRVPVRAVSLTCIIIVLLSLLNLNSEAFVALGAISSLSSIALYFSYIIILSVALYARLTTGLPKAEWSIGRASIPVNIFALVYTAYTMIFLPFPTDVPVTAENMNFSGPVFLAVMAGAVGSWFVWAKDNWAGPNQAVVDYVLRAENDAKTNK